MTCLNNVVSALCGLLALMNARHMMDCSKRENGMQKCKCKTYTGPSGASNPERPGDSNEGGNI